MQTYNEVPSIDIEHITYLTTDDSWFLMMCDDEVMEQSNMYREGLPVSMMLNETGG